MIRINTYGAVPVIHQTDNYIQPGITGAVQWNGNSRRLQVSNGSSWMDIDNNVNLTASLELTETIAWATKKIKEEKELEALARTNTTIADLLQARKKVDEQIKMVQILIKQEIV